MLSLVQEKSQNMIALDKANTVRLARAARKREVRAGTLSIADAMTRPEMQTCTIRDLLRAQHRWGDYRVNTLLARLAIPQGRTIAQLTHRQRECLLSRLP